MRNAFKILQLKTLTNFLNKEVDEKTVVDNDAADSISSTYSASKIEERINNSVNEGLSNYVKTFERPSSFSVETGSGSGAPAIGDVLNLFDGNVMQVVEVAGTPGFDVRFTFTNVTSVKGIGLRFYYDGGVAGHTVTFDLYDYINDSWDSYLLIPSTAGYSYRYIEFPNGARHIYPDGRAISRFYHSSGGNASHDLYIDFIGLAY